MMPAYATNSETKAFAPEWEDVLTGTWPVRANAQTLLTSRQDAVATIGNAHTYTSSTLRSTLYGPKHLAIKKMLQGVKEGLYLLGDDNTHVFYLQELLDHAESG